MAPLEGGPATERRYRDHTLILESEWQTDAGRVRVIDFMPPRDASPDIIRIVEGLEGTVTMRTELVIRLDYGSLVPWITRWDVRTLLAVGGPDGLVLRTPIQLEPEGWMHTAEFNVRAGDRIPFVLTWFPSHEEKPRPVDAEQELVDTESYWRTWMKDCKYEGDYGDAVFRSVITLKALTYQPTGGIVAAPTTSLPERIGGERNWDYRYCWLRDATFSLYALLNAGFVAEARAWRDWLLRSVAGDPANVQILYGIGGQRRVPEQELSWLPGYAGSLPVRIGNAAHEQFQLDVYGEVMDVLHQARVHGLDPDDHAWSLQRTLLDFLEGAWDRPDEGIWEVRGPRRHFTHSKVLAWVAFDRAVQAFERWQCPALSDAGGASDRTSTKRCAARIQRGLNSRSRSPTAQRARRVDAAIPILGLPPHDPRVIGRSMHPARPDAGRICRALPHDDVNPVDGLAGGGRLPSLLVLARRRAGMMVASTRR
jgi:GH15 family glucan-1,4-alpha-glucosidase